MVKAIKLPLSYLLFVSFAGIYGHAQEKIIDKTFDPSSVLWYDTCAAGWNDALPVGNGRLGAMVFGRPGAECIQFNEDSYWTGGPYSSVVKGGSQYLPEIQQLVFNGEWLKAQKLFGRKLMGYPVEQQKYQSMGNLMLFFDKAQHCTHYKRWLDLKTAVTGVEYSADGIQYRREIFASAPGQAIVIHLTADKQNSISFTANVRGARNQDHSNYATDYFEMDGSGKNELMLTGKSADYLGIAGQLRYEARLHAVVKGGTTNVSGDDLVIKDADEVTLYLVAATNFVNYKDVGGDAHQRVMGCLEAIKNKNYETLLQDHLKDYGQLFGRVTLSLPVTQNSFLPTGERLKNNLQASDPALAALAYQFGRYVLISSSRSGTQAANLQGIWNQDADPMWDSKYTTNINLQMNYWPVESANLQECAEPLLALVNDVTDQGKLVAKEHYGCGGWVFHQNTDLWRVAAPMDGPTWGTFTTAGAWLCNQLWDQYLYTKDEHYLKKIYPLIKGSVQFFMDFLVQQPGTKWLVTNPSSSPENFPDRDGNKPFFDELTGSMIPGTNICAGSSIDMQILQDLFDCYITSSQLLRQDSAFANKVWRTKNLLLPPQAGKDGALQEWAQDWGQAELRHRHLSPLYGLYPGHVFSFSKTPQWMDACKAVLEQRGDGNTEWSKAWKICLWARLFNGTRSNNILKAYFNNGCHAQMFAGEGKVMQIDGTMGITAGISEMLIQSADNKIVLLPALPDEWDSGEFNGVCARGAFILKMKWAHKKITSAEIFSGKGGLCRIEGKGLQPMNRGHKVKKKDTADGCVQFMTSAGESYTFKN